METAPDLEPLQIGEPPEELLKVLTDKQRRRVEAVIRGDLCEALAAREGVGVEAVADSIERATKRILKARREQERAGAKVKKPRRAA